MLKIYAILILTFFTAWYQTGFSQEVCDQQQIQKKVKSLEKKRHRNKSEQFEYGEAYFELAECYRLASDTSYRNNYLKVITIYQDNFNRDVSGEKKVYSIYKIGLCYFYLENYNKALAYMNKAVCAKYLNPDALYYTGLCLVKLHKCDEAAVEFNNYVKLTSDSTKTRKAFIQCRVE